MLAPAPLARMCLAVFLRRTWLLDSSEPESRAKHAIDVLRERAVEARHRELGSSGGSVGEPPPLDPRKRREVVAHHPRYLGAVLVAHPVAAADDEARVRDAEGEQAAGPQHAEDLSHGLVEGGSVHQRHEGYD